MSILDFLITIVFLFIEAIGITYSLTVLISIVCKTRKQDEYSFLELFVAIFITLVLNKILIHNMVPNDTFLTIAIYMSTILISGYKLYNLKVYKAMIIATLSTLFPLLIKAIISLILLDFDLTLAKLLVKPIAYSLFTTGIAILQAAVALIIKICNKSLANINGRKTKYFAPQLIIIFLCLLPNMFFLMVNNFRYSKIFIIINVTQMLLITMVSIFNLRLVSKQEATKQKLENTLIYNKTLSKVNEGVRGFKHDMGNIVQAILGYIAINDSEGAKAYCQNLVLGFNDINTLSILSPKVIDDPGIYGIVVKKILEARENNMSLTLDITTTVSKINFPMFELSRTLGILLDNAIEAGENTDAKKLIISMHHDYKRNSDVISISNSVKDTNIEVDKIFNKNYSTKDRPSGFGLYEIKKFLRKYSQGNITTSIDKKNKLFTQTLTIYAT